jgi:hypothetical protein
MTRRSTRTQKAEPAAIKVIFTPEEGRIETPAVAFAPVNIEVETPSEGPTAAPEATKTEEIQTDVRAKLSKKSVKEDVFVPSNPASLEKAASAVAKEMGFEMTRGTSIGARLIARAQNKV